MELNPLETNQQPTEVKSSTDIRNFLHLYLRCYGRFEGYKDPVQLTGISEDFFVLKFSNGNAKIRISHLTDFTPFLRPLSSMLDSDKKFYGDREEFDPLEFHWLLKEGYDLFGLIAAGKAIDNTIAPTTGGEE